MAEAVGLAIGAAGLVTLFDTCIQAFSMIQTASLYGRDYELLLTRLDVEKTLLLQWGQRTGILSLNTGDTARDPRLDQAPTAAAIEKSLNCIRLLLTDAEALRSDHGEVRNMESTELASNVTSVVSAGRMNSYTESYRRFQAHIGQRQGNASLVRRVKWVIRDRDRFSKLVSEISGFVQCLNGLVTISDRSLEVMMQEDIGSLIQDTRTLRLVEEACAETHTDWSDAASIYLGNSRADRDIDSRIEAWIPSVNPDQEQNSTPLLPHLSTDTIVVERLVLLQAAQGSVESLVQMCESGAVAINARDRWGRSLLRYAADNLSIEVSRFLIRHGSDVNSLEPCFNSGSRTSHLGFLIRKCCVHDEKDQEYLLRRTCDMLSLLMENGADIDSTQPDGYSEVQEVWGGYLQRLVPMFLLARPDTNLNACSMWPSGRDSTFADSTFENNGYTLFLMACKALFDELGHKPIAISWFLQYGADVEAKCEPFGNSALHLALLSARDGLHRGSKLWEASMKQVQNVLTSLLRGGVNAAITNKAGLTPKDVAQGLKCGRCWNQAVKSSGLDEHLLITHPLDWTFKDDIQKRYLFGRWWEDYHHFNDWGCRPGTCPGNCPFWSQYSSEWLEFWRWEIRGSRWKPW